MSSTALTILGTAFIITEHNSPEPAGRLPIMAEATVNDVVGGRCR